MMKITVMPIFDPKQPCSICLLSIRVFIINRIVKSVLSSVPAALGRGNLLWHNMANASQIKKVLKGSYQFYKNSFLYQ